MFRRLREGAETVRFTFDGTPMTAARGDTVAAALLGAGVSALRTSVVTGEPRAPYCLMGVCFECLVTIDGVANRQGCLVPIAEGMDVRSQQGARAIEIPGDRE